MFWFFDSEACGILAPQPGIEPIPPALEGEDLTTGPPGKSPEIFLKHLIITCIRANIFCMHTMYHASAERVILIISLKTALDNFCSQTSDENSQA